MGRRQSKHQPPFSTPPRRPERAGWESDVISQVEQRVAAPSSARVPQSSGAIHSADMPLGVTGATPDHFALPTGPGVLQPMPGYAAPLVDTRELELRELALAVREADLQARRRETAREIRQIRRQAPKIEGRLGDIELLIAELAQAVLQLGHAQQASPELSGSVADPRVPSGADDALFQKMQDEIDSLHFELDSLRRQNEELAGELAQSAVRLSIDKTSDADPTLSWEQRKALLFSQDADSTSEIDASLLSEDMQTEFERLRLELQSRDEELAQLRNLLEQRPTEREEGTMVGAAAIAQMMDGDELIQEERQRLLDLQTEWEAKFRQMEISASIERANLARERQQLERQNAELEEQLAHLKRELKQEEIAGPNQSRRWLAKLGLAD